MNSFWIYWYAVKYWFQGDDWEAAVIYSRRIVEGFRK